VKHAEETSGHRVAVQVADVASGEGFRRIDSGGAECEVLATAMETLYSFGMEVPNAA